MKSEETIIDELVLKLKKDGVGKWPCPYFGKDGCTKGPMDTHQERNNHIRYYHIGKPLPKMSKLEMKARKRIKNEQYRIKSGKQKYNPDRYQAAKLRNYAKGLTAQGREFKDEEARQKAMKRIQREGLTPMRNHKIQPIVYRAPFEVPVRECPHCKATFPPGVVWREAE